MSVALTWQRRLPPLEPVAVVATGAALSRLAEATVRALRAGIELRAARGDDWLLVLADTADALPWADGVTYLGRDSGLLLPTTLLPQPGPAALAVLLPRAPVVAALPGHVLLSELPARAAHPTLVAATAS